jgi:hypothetical protein
LQCGSPTKLRLLATIEDKSGGALEAFLHAQFAKSRRHGEWFDTSPDLMAYIAAHGRPFGV